MDEHKYLIKQCVDDVVSKTNSKVLSATKYSEIVNFLKFGSSGSAKLKWTIKDKEFKLMNFPELNLTDVLCVPAKKKVSAFYIRIIDQFTKSV